MSAKMTPGKRLVRRLTASKPPGTDFSETGQATLNLIEQAANRAEVLRTIFDALTAGSNGAVRSTRSVTEVAAELRQVENALHRLIVTLGLDDAPARPAAPTSGRNRGRRRQQAASDDNVTPLSAYRRA